RAGVFVPDKDAQLTSAGGINVFSKNRDLKFFLKYALIVTTAFYQNGKPNDIALNKRRIYSQIYSGEK
ncbi:hypothetical protein, partial [Ruminococcus sp.]|uniref:hypothetical protein n=1 Tax=Ruminococcus sp. TaxID=41978 RepID=UPI003AB230B6